MRIDIKHLRGFALLAQELNFTRAAERLAIAQPALTQWIQALEEELGAALLKRTTRSVTLTHAGEVFAEQARGVLERLDQALRLTREAALEQQRPNTLRIGCIGSAIRTIVPPFLASMRESHPTITLHVEERTLTALQEAFSREELDVIVTRTRPAVLTKQSVLLSRAKLILIVPPDHALGNRRTVALSALHDEPFILSRKESTPEFTAQTLRACKKAGFIPKISYSTDHMPSMVDLVSTGLGIAIVTADIQATAERAGCHALRLTDSELVSTMWAIARDPTSDAQALALHHLRAVCDVGERRTRRIDHK